MSNREMIAKILDTLPENKLGYVLAYLQGLSVSAEIEDDLFCEHLLQQYLNDPDQEKDSGTSLEACKKEWGLV